MAPVNYSRFINAISAARKASPLRRLTEIQLAGGPDLISFGTGTPNANCFPFESITVKTKDNQSYVLSGDLLKTALQYGPTYGQEKLLAWLKELQIRLHNPPTFNKSAEERATLMLSPGSQDGLGRVIDMVVSPGDSVLAEEPTYPAVKAQVQAMNAKLVSVKSDNDGLIPDSLAQILSNWKPASERPKLIYIQPNHNNPTSVCLPVERRKEIYKIAQQFDLLIVEDDPYYCLTYDEMLPPSFLSMDVDGRVIRLDSFSKVMAAGMRIGIVTGAKPFIERLVFHLQIGAMECPSFSQMVVYELLNRWGTDNFLKHSRNVAAFYESQCNMMVNAAETHLKGLAEWTKPKGGMFMWFKVLGVKDTSKMIAEKALAKKVVLSPGSMFMFDSSKPTSYMRASFSNVTEENMHKGFQRLAELIRSEQAQN